MAASATAYRNSDDLKSERFSPPQPSPLVRRIDASRLPGRYARTLKSFVVVSKHGPDMFASTFKVSIESQNSYRTVQRHLDWLERAEVLKKKHPANEFYVPGKGIRRTATYVLHPDAQKWLSARETATDWERRNKRQAPPRKRPQHARSAPQPVPQPIDSQAPANSIAPPPALAAAPASVSRTVSPRQGRTLTSREASKLVAKMKELMQGLTSYFSPADKLSIKLQPDDLRYRAPMSQQSALISACMTLGLDPEAAEKFLKLFPRGLPEDS